MKMEKKKKRIRDYSEKEDAASKCFKESNPIVPT